MKSSTHPPLQQPILSAFNVPDTVLGSREKVIKPGLCPPGADISVWGERAGTIKQTINESDENFEKNCIAVQSSVHISGQGR